MYFDVMRPLPSITDSAGCFYHLAFLLVFLAGFPALSLAERIDSSFEVQEKETPIASRIVDSQTIESDGRSITYNRLETPPLKAKGVSNDDLNAEETPKVAEELAEPASKHYEMLCLTATVDGSDSSKVSWSDAKGSYVVQSSINFNHLCPLLDFETTDTIYGVMVTANNVQGASLETSIPSNKGERSKYVILSAPEGEGAADGSLKAMDDLHAYYDAHRAELIDAWNASEAFRVAEEQRLRDHPPEAQDTVINFFPIRSSDTSLQKAELP